MVEEIYNEDVETPIQDNNSFNKDLVLVCTEVLYNVPIMYEWMTKDEALIKVEEMRNRAI